MSDVSSASSGFNNKLESGITMEVSLGSDGSCFSMCSPPSLPSQPSAYELGLAQGLFLLKGRFTCACWGSGPGGL